MEEVRADFNRQVQHLQADLDKTILVHRVQFETEFTAIRAVWAKVVALRGTMAAVRPTFDIAPRDETAEQERERLHSRVVAFSNALAEAKDVIFENEPFISEAIYQELCNNVLGAAQAEHISVRVHQPTELDWYDTGEKNVTKLVVGANKVSAMIRARFQRLSVVSGGH